MRPITVRAGPPGSAGSIATAQAALANQALTLNPAAASIIPTSNITITSTNSTDAGSFYVQGADNSGTPRGETVTMPNTSAAGVVTGGLAYVYARFLSINRVVPLFTPEGNIAVQTPAAFPIYSSPIRLDEWADAPINVQVVLSSGSDCIFTVQHSEDDPNSLTDPVSLQNMFWDTGLVPAGAIGGGASMTFGIAVAPLYMRLALNSGTTGFARMTVVQYNVVEG